MKNVHFVASILTLAVTSSQSGLAAPPKRPPPLTFETHVDYVSWYRRLTEKPGKPNAYEKLAKLLDSKNPANNLPLREYREETLQYPFDDLAKGGIVWRPQDLPNVAAYLAKIDDRLDAFELTTTIADYWRAIPAASQRIRGDEPRDSSHFRHATRAILVRAWRETSQMSKQLTKAHCCLAGHCRQLRQSTDLLSWLLYYSYGTTLNSSIRAALHNELLTQAAVEKTSEALLEWNKVPMRFDGMLCLDWAEQLDMLQGVFPRGKYDKKQYEKMTEVYGKGSVPEPRENPQDILEKVNETYDRLVDIAGGPTNRKTWRRIEKHMVDVHGKREPPDYFKFPGSLSAYSRAYLLHLEAETEWRGTLLTLAIHRHRMKEGKWPARLNDLRIPELKRLRIDPFSEGDFQYRLEDGKPLLYSVAVDGKDDGGTHTGRWEGILGKGVDFVFLPYHEPHRFHFKVRNPKTED